jgi:hypothetical protein
MFRLAAFGLLSVASITGAGWLYQVHHLVPVNFDQWSMLKAIRDVCLVGVALIWLFRPSRALIAVAMSAVFVAPAFISANPPDLSYVMISLACVGVALITTQVRRGIPSPFNKGAAPT